MTKQDWRRWPRRPLAGFVISRSRVQLPPGPRQLQADTHAASSLAGSCAVSWEGSVPADSRTPDTLTAGYRALSRAIYSGLLRGQITGQDGPVVTVATCQSGIQCP